MHKKREMRFVLSVTFLQIFLMIFSTVAIAFVIGEGVRVVSAAEVFVTINGQIRSYPSQEEAIKALGGSSGVTQPPTTLPSGGSTNGVLAIAEKANAGVNNVYGLKLPDTVDGQKVTGFTKDAGGQLGYMNEKGQFIRSLNADEIQTAVKAGNAAVGTPDMLTAANGYSTTNIDILKSSTDATPTSVSAFKSANGRVYTVEGGKVTEMTKNGDVYSPVGSTASTAPTFELMGLKLYSGWGHLASGVMWAVAAVGAIQLVGSVFGFNKGLTNALTYGAVAGIATWKLLEAAGPRGFNLMGGENFLTRNSGLIGIAVAVVVFLVTYKSEKFKTVKFECLPFEPPIGGNDCEKCNKDTFRPCSEYRCKSLGQACQLLNKGTTKEYCAWVSPKDVKSPVITPWKDALYPTGLKYTPDNAIRPPNRGVKIVNPSDNKGCMQAFTQLHFGVTLDKPAQCKIDYNHTTSFDQMQFYMGESNYFDYNHTQIMKLPVPESSPNNTASPLLKNDGSASLYVRCKDANGNENVDEYVFNFCVNKGPDTTPPVIEGTSIVSGSPIRYDTDTAPIELYINEPSQCKWSRKDKSYDEMENSMSCATDAAEMNSNLLYTCSGNLTNIKNQVGNIIEESSFYFRCKDQPNAADNDRNTQSQSYKLTLRGSRPLSVSSIAPNGTIYDSATTATVKLQVRTDDGSDEGKASCSFSNVNGTDTFVKMFTTDLDSHEQELDLTSGDYNYYVRCIDPAGNAAYASTSFKVRIDKSPPAATRIYKEGPDAIKVTTNEDALCTYSITSCNFNINEGLKTVTQGSLNFINWQSKQTYYIKCKDSYGNEPSPNQCTVIVSTLNAGKTSSG